ncbi:MAG: tetratricopeptide repeat protein [Bacteroidia bacterium]|nr:tetratricopeptide repeat protein [Bacteroidia bacterium]
MVRLLGILFLVLGGFFRLSGQPEDTTAIQALYDSAYREGLQDPAAALRLIEQGEENSRAQGWEAGLAEGLSQRAMLARRKGEYDEATRLFAEVLSFGEKNKNLRLKGSALNNLGILQWNLRNYREGLVFFQRALAVQQIRKDTTAIANSLSNIGMIHTALGVHDSAILCYTQTLDLYQQKNHSKGIATMYHNLAVSYRELGNLNLSNEYLHRALPLYTSLGDLTGQINTLKNIAKNHLKTENSDSLLRYLQPALELAKKHGMLKEQMDCYEVLSEHYASTGDYRQSREQLQNFIAVRDSQFTLDKTRQLADLQAKYEAELNLSGLQVKIEREKRIRQGWTFFAIGLLLLAGVLGYAQVMRLRRNKAEGLRLRSEHEAERLRADSLAREMEFKNRALTAKAIYLVQKNQILSEASQQLKELISRDKPVSSDNLKKIQSFISQNLRQTDQWEEFLIHFEQVHPGFFDRLRQVNPQLTAYDLRFSAYLRLNLSNKEIAALLHATLRAVDTQRYRLRKKLALDASQDLVVWMQNI